MLSGERRWGASSASARRGGMTVLGKVAKVTVPKPINLPSQRGTLSWGSRSSSSTSNAWGSSALSPRADGSTGSPSHASGRPSSGGSSTRPSTAGSDRAHEPTANAWGQNSRPSSASGALTSSQTSLTSLRPRSAETRPGSSQLSRFAEQSSENPGPWSAAGTAEKLGVTAPKKDAFSLTSGDFPTLGSEKDISDHGSHRRPGSSSGGIALPKERSGASIVGDVSVNANVKSGVANSWVRDTPAYSDEGVTTGAERWQGDPQPYPNPSIPPQHFEAWHGPPVTNPPGWFRPPGGPPYGAPVAPGGFPMEPFYYRPQIPPTSLPNPQPGPPPGGAPRGHHPKNGDLYRPHMPDAYIRPGMPMRPGFFPGPVAYDGYYGPPMGYHASNERDVPFMGMAAGPHVYNRYPSQNVPEPGNSQGRSGGYGSTGKTSAAEHVESGHHHDTRGPYKVLLKPQNCWEGKNEEKKWEGTVATNAAYVEKGDQPGIASWENDRRSDYRNDEEMALRRTETSQEVSSQTYDNQRSYSSVPVKVKSPESVGSIRVLDDISVTHLEHESPGLQEVQGPVSAVPKDSSLIQKIEGLNAKARASDGRHDIASVSSLEERKDKFQVQNAKANHSTNEGGSGFVYTERTHTTGMTNSASREMGFSAGDKSLESTVVSGTTISRRSTHGVQGRGGNRGRGALNSQEVDGWRKKSPVVDSPSVVLASHSDVHVHDHHTSFEASAKSGPYPVARDERESAAPVSDPSDYQAQRPKLRELEQRAKQLKEEEEERTRRQMAKAHAKLEELNKRKQSMDGSNQQSEDALSGAIQNKQELNVVPQISEGSTGRVEQSCVLSSELPPEKPKSANREPLVQNQSVSLQRDADCADVAHVNNAPHVHDGNASKPKRMNYKQKQNILSEKKIDEKSISTRNDEAPKSHPDAAGKVTVSVGGLANESALSCESSLPVNANAVAESSVHQRKKNNRSVKNKHKAESASSMAALQSSESKETNLVNASVESGRPKASESEMDPNSIESVTISKDANQLPEQRLSLPSEDHGRVNSQGKSQQSRRTPRNPHVNRSAERIQSDAIWAPVRSQNKADIDEASHKNVVESSISSIKSDHQVQSNPKKRAEMERYIPKPVAKEMAQQGSIQQPVASSMNQNTSDETVGKADSSSQFTEISQPASSASGKVGLPLESRNGDGRQNKQGKAHGSWRQRGSTESVGMQSMQEGPSSYPDRNVQKSIEDFQPQKPDVSSVKEQPKYSEESNASDGWNIPNNSDSVPPVAVSVIKDHGVTGRTKRHPLKGQKGMGNNNDSDHKKINTHSSASEMSQSDLPTSKENRGLGDRSTAHWQPKSQMSSANYQRGGRTNSGQSVDGEVAWTNKKESTPQGEVPLAAQQDKRSGEVVPQPHHDESPSTKSTAEEALNVGHQEAKRGRKVGSLKGRTHSPNQVHVSPVENAPANIDVRHEQRSSSGFRKSGNQNNNRFGRGNESRGDWNSSGQDSKHNNQPVNWERQRHNSHYEYQPVGPYNNNKSNNAEGPKDGTHNAGPRFRERGPSHSRRGGGNFYGRQSGNDRVDAGYEL
ncbi:hypothetical protein ACJW30_04G137100 [Castanea mollissima]